MPELPEVETTLQGIKPHVEGETIRALIVREPRLRWPIPSDLPDRLQGQRIRFIGRRGKYLLFELDRGFLILHLGMSGSLRVLEEVQLPRKHDHWDLVLGCGRTLRYHDPRRFGCLLFTAEDPAQHALIRSLGPEPLSPDFDGEWLYQQSRGSKVRVKTFIMNARQVVGVGNIYANESLFRAGISPRRQAGVVGRAAYLRLAKAIQAVLSASIAQGGTTLRDFVNSSGQPGYFRQTLAVYERAGEPCRTCGCAIKSERQAQRSTYWCPNCQT